MKNIKLMQKDFCIPFDLTECWGHFKTFDEAERERLSLEKHGNKACLVDLINYDNSLNVYRWGVAYTRKEKII
jgi:hypothetical protein